MSSDTSVSNRVSADRNDLPIVLVANARMPSERAQSIQIAQVAASFERAGAATQLWVAERTHTQVLPAGVDLFDHYCVPRGSRPRLERIPCSDWVDSVPRRFQFGPARLQELTFSRNAARRLRNFEGRVLSREIECAYRLVKAGHPRVFLEVHRVPGGQLRRKWLLAAAVGCLGVLAISGGVRDDLVALGIPAADILVAHDGVEASALMDPERFSGPGSSSAWDEVRSRARQNLSMQAEALLVVYAGGLLAWKGVDDLVEAARSLADLQFVIAGGMAADVEALRQRAQGLENVRIDGFQAPNRIRDYWLAADLACVPNRSTPAISARYTSPLKVFEAMAAGTPLVVSDLPSLRDILEPERDAIFAPADDPAGLAKAIRRLADDPELRAKLRANLLQRAPNNTWDARAQRILTWMGERSHQTGAHS